MFVRGISWHDHFILQIAGDGLTNYATAKSLADGLNGTINPNLGAPNGLSIFAIPSLDMIYLLVVWIISIVSGNGIFAINLIYYLGFGAVFASSFWVLSRKKNHFILKVILSLSYAFIPEHWARQGHLALSLYWTLPIASYYCILLANDEFNNKIYLDQKQKLFQKLKISGFLVVITFQGFYYATFTLFLAGALLIFSFSNKRYVSRVSMYIFTAQATLFITSSIFTAQLAQYCGTNLAIFQRGTTESVLYGGHLPFLFLPWPGSGLPGSSRINAAIENAYPGSNEFKIWSSFLVSCFMLAMIWNLLPKKSKVVRKLKNNEDEIIILQMLFTGLALYISGGLGFAIAVFEPQLRAWNRISFLLSFLAIMWFAEQIPKLVKTIEEIKILKGNHKLFGVVGSSMLFTVLLIDQFPINLKADFSNYQQSQNEIKKFVMIMEKELPKNCIVLQVPPAEYPEMPPIQKMADYELLIPYLYSKQIRFTYGAMKQSQKSKWQNLLPKEYSSNFIDMLAANDFCAVLWDRQGLTEGEFLNLSQSLKDKRLSVNLSQSERWGFTNLESIKLELSSSNFTNLRIELLVAPQP